MLFLRTFLQHMSFLGPYYEWRISLISLSLRFYFHLSLPNPKTASSAPPPTPHTPPLAFSTMQAVRITIQGQQSSIFSQHVEGTERIESLLLMT